MYCPITSYHKPYQSSTECMKRACAFWDEEREQCCIKTMALAAIAKPSDDFSAPTSTSPAVISSSSSEPYKYTYTITYDLGEIVQ